MNPYSSTQSPRDWRRGSWWPWRKSQTDFSPIRRRTFRSRLKKLLLVFAVAGVFCILLGVLGILGAVAFFAKDLPPPDQLIQRQTIESSKIYERTGTTVLYELHGDIKRTYIKLDEIPKYVPQATIAIEDKNFYQHRGINFGSILKAIIEKFTKGGRLRGASTITQQLVKNAILSPERTLTRKFKEWILSLELERRYNKEQILELYLNEIPYGSVVYGIESASQTFFGKSAKDLNVAEAAILAAIPKAPTYFSPHGTHRDELIARQWVILTLMAEQGYITFDEAELYQQEKIEFKFRRESIEAPHFVSYVRELLAEQYGEKFLEEGGLKVVTTLDLEKQRFAQTAIEKQAKINSEQWNASNAALTAMDPRTGQILVMVGSVDFFDAENDGQVNVTLSQRQPGSSFKPIVYAAAFKKGYTPDTILYDVDTVFKDVCIGDPNYEPHNYTGLNYGPVTMRKAMAGSLNIPAVKTIYLTGVDQVVDLGIQMGYTTLEKQRGNLCLSLVLGGADVRLLDHVTAFSVFAQEGIKHEPAAIIEIRDKDDKKIFQFEDKKIRVLDQEITRMTTSILSDNDARSYIFGSANKLILKDRPVAAKTGTTNDYKDAWIIGFTPSLITGVWVGNNDFKIAMKKGADGSKVAAPIWNEFMEEALKGTQVEQFGTPPENTSEKPVLRGVSIQEVKVAIDQQSGKRATEYTPLRNITERVYHPLHDILHYINKEDPRGPSLRDPTVDPQYVHWEAAVRKWAEKQNIVIDSPPVEFDDIHTAENKPQLVVLSPQENTTIRTRHLSVDIQASAPRNISEAVYAIDDVSLISVKTDPFDLEYDLHDEVGNGFHTLKVFVYDDFNNFDSVDVDLNFLLEPLPSDFTWKNIRNSVSLKRNNFPYAFSGKIVNFHSVRKIEIQYRSSENNISTVIETTDPKSAHFSFQWVTAPTNGTYELYAVLRDSNDRIFTSDSITVMVKE